MPHDEKRLNIFAKYFADGYKLFSFSKAGFNHDMKGTYAQETHVIKIFTSTNQPCHTRMLALSEDIINILHKLTSHELGFYHAKF